MGNRYSAVEQNRLSEVLYQACSSGTIDRVRELLPNCSYDEVNYIYPTSGLTPLQIACSNNHYPIVQLLLANNVCDRTIRNNMGRTAYDETVSREVRSLFNRSSLDDRFGHSLATLPDDSPFQLIDATSISTNRPDHWVTGHFTLGATWDSQIMIGLSQVASPLMKWFLRMRTERECREIVLSLIQMHIPIGHREYDRVHNLYRKFIDQNTIQPLLTIYSMSTPLYEALRTNADAYTVLVYLHLNDLRQETFQGLTFRGMNISFTDLEAYKWAYNHAAILQTRLFQSTSRDFDVAKIFSEHSPVENRVSIILRFEFPQPCLTAIKLDHIAHYQQEEEILLLPFTLFRVISISEHMEQTTEYYVITLKNLPVPLKSLWTLSRKRYQ